jgi:hypothetical protein
MDQQPDSTYNPVTHANRMIRVREIHGYTAELWLARVPEQI